MSIVSNGTPGAAMKCLVCGAEMRLIDVCTEATTPFGIERRIFQCSSCRQSAQRLAFDRTRMPFSTSPAITPSDASAMRLQRDRHAATSTAANAVEMRSSPALAALEPHRPSIEMRWSVRSAAPSKSKRRKQERLRGRGRWKSSGVGRWHSKSARLQWTHPTRSARAITAIIIRGL